MLKLKHAIAVILEVLGILIIALIYKRLIEVPIITIVLILDRKRYPKTFHAKTMWMCLLCTLTMYTIICALSLPFYISIGVNIFLIHYTAKVLYYIKDYFDMKYTLYKHEKVKNYRARILAIVPNNEAKIEKLCTSYALRGIAETIYLYLNNTIEETAAILEIDSATVNRRVRKFLNTVEA